MVISKESFTNRASVIATIIAAVSGSIAGGISGIVWGARQDVRVENLEKNYTDTRRDIQRIDDAGSRQVPLLTQRQALIEQDIRTLSQRVDAISNSLNTLSPLQQTILESIRAELKAIQDRQQRLSEAIDNTYNLLNEHLRLQTNGDRTKNTPLPRSKPQ